MLTNLKSFLRKRATGNGCEVVLPWFPEAKPENEAMRLIRATRNEPEGSKWINYPVACICWFTLSFIGSLKTCSKYGKKVSNRTGVGCITQFTQMIHLAWMKNICPIEYYEHRFFRKEYRDHAEYFIPSIRQGLITRDLHEGRDTDELDHKLNAFRNLSKAGIPTVDILDVFYANGKRAFSKDVSDLDQFTGRDLFVKPLNGYGGFGAHKWIYQNERGTYTDGERSVTPGELWQILADEATARTVGDSDKQARLLQPLIYNHPDLEDLSRNSLNTARVVSFIFPDGRHEFLYASLRMGTGNDFEDTTHAIVAEVELPTGVVKMATSRENGKIGETHHPDTGGQIKGKQLPYWSELLDLAKRAHMAFPDLPLIGWDIAITPDGPLIIEANCNPRMQLIQIQENIPVSKTSLAKLYFAWQAHRSEQEAN